ncbi:MAG: hypothetical protein ACOC1X_00565 [Promethearchaeota archaeon]
MKRVQSKSELHQIRQLGNTIYLRKNIEQVEIETEDSTEEVYEADEVWFEKENADLQHIHDNFDLYWNWAKEKRENEKLRKEKRKKVKKLIDKDYDLADLKETVDQLVKDNLSF